MNIFYFLILNLFVFCPVIQTSNPKNFPSVCLRQPIIGTDSSDNPSQRKYVSLRQPIIGAPFDEDKDDWNYIQTAINNLRTEASVSEQRPQIAEQNLSLQGSNPSLQRIDPLIPICLIQYFTNPAAYFIYLSPDRIYKTPEELRLVPVNLIVRNGKIFFQRTDYPWIEYIPH